MHLFSSFTFLSKLATHNTKQYNRFGTKNGYIFMILRVYFDIGFYGMNQAAAASVKNAVEGFKQSSSNVNNACNTM